METIDGCRGPAVRLHVASATPGTVRVLVPDAMPLVASGTRALVDNTSGLIWCGVVHNTQSVLAEMRGSLCCSQCVGSKRASLLLRRPIVCPRRMVSAQTLRARTGPRPATALRAGASGSDPRVGTSSEIRVDGIDQLLRSPIDEDFVTMSESLCSVRLPHQIVRRGRR